jgi:RNA polymerase sigma-70 factor (ECF subfamily)
MHLINANILERWKTLSDEQVVERILDGQTALFEILMRRHNERLYRAARAIVRDDNEAEDVMQQAYVNAYAHLRQFDGRAAFATWLTRITVNEAIARTRRRDRYETLNETDALSFRRFHSVSARTPEAETLSQELRVLLESAVDSLPEGYRVVFMLREVEGLSTAETAACLDLTEDVVRTRLSRARSALRQELFDRVGLTAAGAFIFQRPRCDRVVIAVLARIG